jgi:hypothetical protein
MIREREKNCASREVHNACRCTLPSLLSMNRLIGARHDQAVSCSSPERNSFSLGAIVIAVSIVVMLRVRAVAHPTAVETLHSHNRTASLLRDHDDASD